jgi:hypothetical protein
VSWLVASVRDGNGWCRRMRSFSGAEGKRDDDAGPAFFAVRCRDGSAVRARNRIDERQSKPVSVGIPAFDTAFKQMRQHLLNEPRAIVFED